VSRKDNRSPRHPLPRHMQHGHPIHDRLSILVTTQPAGKGRPARHHRKARRGQARDAAQARRGPACAAQGGPDCGPAILRVRVGHVDCEAADTVVVPAYDGSFRATPASLVRSIPLADIFIASVSAYSTFAAAIFSHFALQYRVPDLPGGEPYCHQFS